jgi:DNA-binding NarL/FixJ family response regulator
MKRITVLLSDDHAIFHEGLRLLLEATDDIEVIVKPRMAQGNVRLSHPN